MKTLFYLSFLGIVYAYFGYPLLMMAISKLKKAKPIEKGNFTPFISIVIPAYNEEKNIGAKLKDFLNSSYPPEKMEIFVISDASTDRTDEIVEGFADKGIKLFKLQERSGKIAAYRKILPILKGEIVIFSDATSLISYNSIQNLINNFNDKTVGCAGGLLVYINPGKATVVGKGEKKYWSYEKRIRTLESTLCSLPSVSGTLYGVRKNLFPMDMKDYLADDLIVPIKVRKSGYRTVFEKEATCKDYTTTNIREEMSKRIRITAQNLNGLVEERDIFNFFRYRLFSIIIISHKLFRLLVPVFLILIFFSSLIMSFYSSTFLIILLLQVLFYATGISGYFINKIIKFSIGNAIFYFCLSNLAILFGIVKFIKGTKFATWQTVRI
jgi:poly-beta-1,6-N-acetyl-D-glucosamine synthase